MTTTMRMVLLAVLLAVWDRSSAQSSLVSLGASGKLGYVPYANTGQTNAVNIVPDFSFAGYRGGGVPIPFVSVAETVSPVAGDARSVIQAAINRVSLLPMDSKGVRGAVLLKAGRYEVNGSLSIKASGVVLRGEGQNTPENGGTELVATAKTQHDFLTVEGNESTAEPTPEIVLDTQVYPAVRTWQSFNVRKGAAEKLEGDKIISFHVTADVNQYVNYASREDSIQYRPVLEITVRRTSSGRDSLLFLHPVADTYIQGGTSAKINFGADPNLAVKNAGTNNNVTREAYLRFDLSAVKDSMSSAVLKLYTKKDLATDAAAVKVVSISASSIEFDAWNEMTLTYETRPLAAGSAGARRIATAYVPSGASSFEVDSVAGYAVGDTINVTRTPNDAWITALDMAQYGWVASEYRISSERIITGINGRTISVNAPLVQAMENAYGGGEIIKVSVQGRISSCGVENMMISSYYASDEDESHGWAAVTLAETENCWVRRVTARYFGYSCVSLSQAYHSTIEECAMLDPKSITTGSRKYSFYIDKGSFNLFQRCYARGGRHDFVTGSRVSGPNAFVDFYSTQTYADIGPHHRYATGLLFDNIQGGETRVQNRKAMGSGHGWAGAQTMFWNCISNTSEFKVESPIGAMNWGIGCSGLVMNGAGFWESWGTPVAPRSLYYQQLCDRLGSTAVENVTVSDQRAGSMWPLLVQWAGLGSLTIATGVGPDAGNVPRQFALSQNYPNPFNPAATIRYDVPVRSSVVLKVYDVLGNEITTLVNGTQEAGTHSVRFDASGLSSGLYVYSMRTANFISNKKMMVIK